MNSRILFLLIPIFLLGSIASKADTPEEFLAVYRTALEQKDTNKLLSLYYTNGCSESDMTLLNQMAPMANFGKGKLTNLSFEPIPKGLNTIQINDGKKYEPTCPAVGIIKSTYVTSKDEATNDSEVLYAVQNGKHYLVTSKSTDLGWNGPKDHPFAVSVIGPGQQGAEITYAWNVSGIDQKTTVIGSGGFTLMGQYIDSLSVTSDNDHADVVCTIRECTFFKKGEQEFYDTSAGKVIYSKPLKGKGTIEYKRQVQK